MAGELSAETLAAGLLIVAALLVLSGLLLRPPRQGPNLNGPAVAGALAVLGLMAAGAWLRRPLGPAGLGAAAGALIVLAMAVLRNPLATCGIAAGAGAYVTVFAGESAMAVATGLSLGGWACAWSFAVADRAELRRALGWAALLTLCSAGAALGHVREQGELIPLLLPTAALPVGLGAVAALVAVDYRPKLARYVGALVGAGLLAALVHALGAGSAFVKVYLAGLLAGLLLEALRPAGTGEGEDWSRALRDGLLAALLLAATGAVAFELERGLGVLLAALGVASVGQFLEAGGEESDTPVSAGGFALGALAAWSLFRLCYERVPLTEARVDLYVHTTFVGLLLGLAAPFLAGLAVAAYRRRTAGRPGKAWERVEVTLVTVLALALPGALAAILWGPRAAAAVVAGATAGPLLLLSLSAMAGALPEEARAWFALLPAAYATSAACAVTATVMLADLGFKARHWKLEAVLIGLLVVLAYAAVRAWLDRRSAQGDEA